MGRTNLAKARVRANALKIELREAVEKRNKISNYLKKIHLEYDVGKISYGRYHSILTKDNKGKTLNEWFSYYDQKILNLKFLIYKNQKVRKKGVSEVFLKYKIPFVFLFLFLIISIASLFVLGKGSLLGFLVLTPENQLEIVQDIELDFYEDSEYIWNISEHGQLTSFKISGYVEGQGNVRVYFEDYLVYEKWIEISVVEENQSEDFFSPITGIVVGNVDEPGIVMYVGGFFQEIGFLISDLRQRITGFSVEDSGESGDLDSSESNGESSEDEINSGSSESSNSEDTTSEEVSETTQDSEDSDSGDTESKEVSEETDIDSGISPFQLEDIGDNEISSPSEEDENETEIIEELEINEAIEELEINETIEEPEINITTNETYSEENQTTEVVSNETEVSPSLNETISEPSEIINDTEIIGETDIIEEIEEGIIRFFEECGQTCDLRGDDLNETSYVIRIEIEENSETGIYLDNFTYSLEIENVSEIINESLQANLTNVSVKQYQAVVGEPVKWEKIVELDEEVVEKFPNEELEVEVDIEDIAEEIVIEDDKGEEIVDARNVDRIQNKFVEKKQRKEPDKVKNVTLKLKEKNVKKYNVTYETPAPEKEENNISVSKKIVNVSAPMKYKDVLIETELPVPLKNKSAQVKWKNNQSEKIIPKENITFIDEDKDGLYEKISWNISEVSNETETFEIDLTILNPVEYLRDGDTWQIRFTTVGIANLSIWSENASFEEIQNDINETIDEMEFLNLSCGNKSLADRLLVLDVEDNSYNYSEIGINETFKPYRFFIEDYSCEETATFNSYMNIGGYAVLEFEFRNKDTVIRQQAIDPYFPTNFTGFEADSSSPYDGWVDGGTSVTRASGLADYCSDTACPDTGSYSILITDDDSTAELSQTFDFSTACGGEACTEVIFSGYLYPNSYETNEGFSLVCDYGDASEQVIDTWTESGGDTVCGYGMSDNTTWEFFSCNLSAVGCTLDSSTKISIIGGQLTAPDETTGDRVYVDGLNVTGYVSDSDSTVPQINLETPVNNTLETSDSTPDFVFNFTDYFNETVSCIVYVDNGTIYNIGSNSSTINDTSTTITSNLTLSNMEYWWWVNCSDGDGNGNKSEVRNLTIDNSDSTVPQINLETPVNNTLETSDSTPDFVFNFTDYFNETASCIVYIDNGTTYNVGSNSSTINDTSTTITSNTTLSSMEYWWWVNCTDGTNENKSIEIRNLTFADTTIPQVNLETPANNTLETSDSTPNFVFNFIDYGNPTSSCTLYVNNGTVYNIGSNSSTINDTSTTITSNLTLSNMEYWWWVNCSDGKNQNKSIEIRNLTLNISEIPPTEISSCQTISDSGNYILTQNVTSSTTCFTISATDVILDCNSSWINYSTGGVSGYGVYTTQANTTIKDCYIYDGTRSGGGADRYGIFLGGSDNSTVFNNFVNTSNGRAIRAPSSIFNINVTGNTAWSDSANGMYISSENSYIGYNDFTSISAFGLDVGVGSKHNTFIGNNGTSDSNAGIFVYNSFNNTFIDCIAVSDSDRAFEMDNSDNNTMIGLSAKGISSGSVGIFIDESEDSLFIDCVNITGVDYDIRVWGAAGSSNNTFINCSYDLSKESIAGASGNEIIRKWYYQAYVNSSTGSAIENANISVYNSSNMLAFTALTNSSGWIQIQNLTEYINVDGTRTYQNNFTIYANYSDYTNATEQYNLSVELNNVNDFFTLTSPDVPPSIYDVMDVNAITLTVGPNPTFVQVNFSVSDLNGWGTLDNSSAMINLTKSGESTRFSKSTGCTLYEGSGDYANYTCNVTMWWFDGSGDWNIYVNISDGDSNNVVNITDTLTVNALTGFEISPSSLDFNELTPGNTNITPTSYFVLNNTGNQEITSGNVQINASDLRGETNSGYALWAGNFSVSSQTGSNIECSENVTGSSTQLVNFSFIGIPNVILPVGNFTINDGTGQENMYMCLREVGSDLIEQRYSTDNLGAWTIRVLLVALGVRRNRKKNKRRNYSVPISIFNKKLGALETLSKYMRENFGLSYHDIGEILNRDERTIWTACKKANEKQSEKVESRELGEIKEIYLPMEIFEDRNFTPLESIINYLKIKGMKYSEIAELLDRDQRNIWTIYNRMKKKFGLEGLESKLEDVESDEIPTFIFEKGLGVLESISKYMRENLEMSYSEIAKKLNRDERTIWNSCKKANEKKAEKFEIEKDRIYGYIDLNIFKNRNFTPLESIINYLKIKGMKYSDIAELLDRDQRNIWTIYYRISKKQSNNI